MSILALKYQPFMPNTSKINDQNQPIKPNSLLLFLGLLSTNSHFLGVRNTPDTPQYFINFYLMPMLLLTSQSLHKTNLKITDQSLQIAQ